MCPGLIFLCHSRFIYLHGFLIIFFGFETGLVCLRSFAMCTRLLRVCKGQMSPSLLLPPKLGGHPTETASDISMTDQGGVGVSLCRWPDLARLARALLPPGDETRRTLENASISRSCDDLLLVFDPVCEALNKMQRATTTISEAVEIWIELLQRAPRNAGSSSANCFAMSTCMGVNLEPPKRGSRTFARRKNGHSNACLLQETSTVISSTGISGGTLEEFDPNLDGFRHGCCTLHFVQSLANGIKHQQQIIAAS